MLFHSKFVFGERRKLIGKDYKWIVIHPTVYNHNDYMKVNFPKAKQLLYWSIDVNCYEIKWV